MNRFIAIIWNRRATHALPDASALAEAVAAARPDWSRRWDKLGAVVFEAPHRSRAEAGLAIGEHALLLGAGFRGANAALADDADAHAAASDLVETVLQMWWGRYVLIVEDEPGACVFVARDPSGALPCFMARRGWAFVFFSHPDDVAALALESVSLDWVYVAERLANNRVITERTGLMEVEVLPPGAVACVGQGRRSLRQVWTPRAIAAKASRCDGTEAATALRGAVEQSCNAWRSLFGAVTVRLSGGLDSSIVLGAIADRSGVTALNYATRSPEGDERPYARAAAVFAGVQLIERMRDPLAADLETAASAQAPSLNPLLWLADGETDAIEAAFAREHGVAAFLSGRGGDNVFLRSESPDLLRDWLMGRGPGPHFWRRCWQRARETGESFGEVVKRAFNLSRPAASAGEAGAMQFLSEQARSLLPTEDDVDVEGGALALGKQLHIRMLEDRLNYFDHRPHADYIYPLVSQPVLEACLSVPTYVLAPGGADRGLARAAFAPVIAPDILRRRSKGRTNTYLAQILLQHQRFVRRYLLDGALAEADMLARAPLAAALSEEGLLRQSEHHARIVGWLGVEAWLRNPPRAGSKVS